MRRAYGTGSLFQRRDGRWVFARNFRDERGRKITRYVTGFDRDEVESKGALLTIAGVKPAKWVHRHDHRTGRERAALAQSYIRLTLETADCLGWTDAYTAKVIWASLRPTRLRHGIYGSCHYCGDWTATEVDHVIPTNRGGTDDPENVVSACKSCNSRKGDKTPDEWRKTDNIAANGAA